MATAKSSSPAGRTVAKGDHVYLIDASGYIFRAYHALPPLTRPSDGLPVGAVHGFCGMLWKLLRETGELAPPTHLAAIFDLSEHTFRNELFSDYKANRSDAARRPHSAISADPRRSPCLQRRLHREARLRGRRSDRDLRARGSGGRSRGDHRVIRQGSDAARAAGRADVRHDEEQDDRRGRGDRALRRTAVQGGRGAGADRRFDRQRAGRAGHRS